MTDEKTVIERPLNQKFVEAREARGLTKEDICGQLNLSLAQLNKLEDDALIPAELSFFERGYVRNYAAYLEIDKSEYMHYFPNSSSELHKLHSVRRYSTPVNKPLLGSMLVKFLLVILVVVGIGFMVNEMLSNKDTPSKVWEQTEDLRGDS